MDIMLKDKIKIDNNFIKELISRSWQDIESIQNQINSIEVDSSQATKVVKLLRDLLTSYYVFIGCLESLEQEQISTIEPTPEPVEDSISIPEGPKTKNIPEINILDRFDTEPVNEPFEYFVDFDEPTGDPLTDNDLYS